MQIARSALAGHTTQDAERGRQPISWEQVSRELAEVLPLPTRQLAAASEHRRSENSLHADLHRTVDALAPLMSATGRKIEIEPADESDGIRLGDELCKALQSVLVVSLSSGTGHIRVRTSREVVAGEKDKIVLEASNDSIDIPDGVRRKLIKAVNALSGETVFITAAAGSGVRIRLPAA